MTLCFNQGLYDLQPDAFATPGLPAPSARLEFRFWRDADTDLAWELWGDPLVSQYIGGPFSREQVQSRLERHLRYGHDHGFQYWPLFLREDSPLGRAGEFAGCCGLKPCKFEQASIEHGFYLRPRFHGQGLGYEAARTVLAYAFASLGAALVFAGHHPENEASRGLIKKLGFRYAFDEFYEPTGLFHPGYLLCAPDFLTLP